MSASATPAELAAQPEPTSPIQDIRERLVCVETRLDAITYVGGGAVLVLLGAAIKVLLGGSP